MLYNSVHVDTEYRCVGHPTTVKSAVLAILSFFVYFLICEPLSWLSYVTQSCDGVTYPSLLSVIITESYFVLFFAELIPPTPLMTNLAAQNFFNFFWNFSETCLEFVWDLFQNSPKIRPDFVRNLSKKSLENIENLVRIFTSYFVKLSQMLSVKPSWSCPTSVEKYDKNMNRKTGGFILRRFSRKPFPWTPIRQKKTR